jgi:DNA repair exonuclease SbcCD ATPase subunit
MHTAKDHYDGVVAGRLNEPGRLSPALVERLAEPLFGLYRDMADRLAAMGEVDLGLATRRSMIELLRGLTGRLGDPVRAQLAAALADLASDLSQLDRLDEADAASADAVAIMPAESAAVQDLRGGAVPLGTQLITWSPLPSTASYAATTATSVNFKIVDLAALQQAGRQRTAAWLAAERPEAQRLEQHWMEQARIELARREAERVQADRAAAEQRAAERAEAAEAERVEAEQRAHAEEAERLERRRRREERMEAHRRELELREAERHEAERLKAEQQELERLQAEIDELERREGKSPPQ